MDWTFYVSIYVSISLLWYFIMIFGIIGFYKTMGFKDEIVGYGKSAMAGYFWSLVWPVSIPVSIAIVLLYKKRGIKEPGT